MCSNSWVRWNTQELGVEQQGTLPGLARLNNLVRSVQTPEFAGVTFHEVLAKSALNKVPGQSYVPFGWTINPYRGCQHACAYCLDPDTSITLADGSNRPLRDVEVGDVLVGTTRVGRYRKYTPSTVLAKWSTRKPAYRIRLADGTTIVASGDHRFLTERGWKYVTGAMNGTDRRPHLTTGNSLIGFGVGPSPQFADHVSDEYRLGYLTGMVRGDGMMLERDYPRTGKSDKTYRAYRFRLALCDDEALERTGAYLSHFGVRTTEFVFSTGATNRRPMRAIRTSSRQHYQQISALIAWPADPSAAWRAGFLAGIFDAEGSNSRGIVQISNSNQTMLEATVLALAELGFDAVLGGPAPNGVYSVRLRGGLPSRQRFFGMTQPAISRKRGIIGSTVKTHADLRVMSVEPLGAELDLLDITTSTGDFIANGVVSHNCFARPTHEYLDLDAGDDFDREIIVKVNVAEVLQRELVRPSWQHEPVALGTNTDPYQRAEGRYSLMPGIIDGLASSGTPFSILTKGTLLRRDLPLLQAAREHVPIDLAMSIAVYDDEVQRSIEPGTPTTAARLATVTAAREAGFDCSVFLMPILPYLTDTRAHLDEAVRRAKAAGATRLVYSALHLRGSVKPWFFSWLAREHPDLVDRYRAMYPGASAYAPKEYRAWLAERMRPLLRAHRLERGREDVVTGGVASTAPRRTAAPSSGLAAASPTMLF
ncbi:intein-containing Rv2578c family radical SAM protein [Agromyces sp. NDB4Y10]|uniref:intein-containing Rv2578c family radical SAM protein n=1 Tax=Agromyces sp. NDB4Y10 TaxID=1775951 RepID=UPI00350F940D